MKKRLKAVTLIIVFLLLFNISLAACGGNEGGNENTNEQKSQKVDDIINSETSSNDKEIVTIRIYNNSGAFKMPGSEKGSNPEILEKLNKLFERELGIRVESLPVTSGSEDEKLNLLLASGEAIDAYVAEWPIFKAKNAILPIKSLLEEYGQNIMDAWSEENWNTMKDKDGEIWAIPRYATATNYPVYIRADWLKKLDLDMPGTINELEAVLKAFKEKDPSGNGTIPMAGDLDGLKYSLLGGFTKYGFSNFMDKDGRIKPVEYEPGFRDWLTVLNSWYNKGYIYRETFGAKSTQMKELILQNKIGVSAQMYSTVSLNAGTLAQNYPNAEYEIAKLEGPEGKIETIKPGRTYAHVVSKSSEHPEAVIEYMNWIYESPHNYITAHEGIEGEEWEYIEKEKNVYKMKEPDNRQYFRDYLFGMGIVTASKIGSNDPTQAFHEDYLKNKIFRFDDAKRPFDLGVVYDIEAITKIVPNKGDIDRLLVEEIIKFIMGVRPISEYDNFLNQLEKAGMDKVIEEYTRQYNEQ